MNDKLEGILDEMDEFITRAINVETTTRTIEMLSGMTIEQVAEGFRDGEFDTKQESPVIPKYVAEFIEEARASGERLDDVFSNLRDVYYQSKTADWIAKESRNSETFARAWLEGYTVVEEQKYYVDLDTAAYVAKWNGDDQVGIYTADIAGSDEFEFHLTEQEIKDFDERFWLFAEPVEGG